MHTILKAPEDLAMLLDRVIRRGSKPVIIDLCSGSGGPMIRAMAILKEKYGISDARLVLTDLYPNQFLASQLRQEGTASVSYHSQSVDAASVSPDLIGIRTMTGSFHHMKPDTARTILKNARDNRQPICIYEISDNSLPTVLWWVSIPMIFLMTLFITPFARPLTWKQLVFTYVLPVVPFFFAWDGAVSNARTYTLEDLDYLIEGLQTSDYTFEKGRISGRAKKLYLLGMPVLTP